MDVVVHVEVAELFAILHLLVILVAIVMLTLCAVCLKQGWWRWH